MSFPEMRKGFLLLSREWIMVLMALVDKVAFWIFEATFSLVPKSVIQRWRRNRRKDTGPSTGFESEIRNLYSFLFSEYGGKFTTSRTIGGWPVVEIKAGNLLF